jgi:hypothetical protein
MCYFLHIYVHDVAQVDVLFGVLALIREGVLFFQFFGVASKGFKVIGLNMKHILFIGITSKFWHLLLNNVAAVVF